MNPYSRRDLFKNSAGMGGAFFTWLLLSKTSKAAECPLTPRQGEGPFYPIHDQSDKDTDLTVLQGSTERAKGQVIFVEGTVVGRDCKPIPGALVEIWQAAASGKYNHEDDHSPLPLDPNFQYWAKTKTNADGRYTFKTITPGHYPVGPSRYRPPHIHYKVHAAGFMSLTTQMYFDPESYDDPALRKIVEELNTAENVQEALKVKFVNSPELEVDSKRGEFSITLRENRI